MQMIRKSSILLFIIVILASCGPKKQSGSASKTSPKKKIDVPAFNADTAFAFVKAQTDFGPRVPNSQAANECAIWLTKTMESFADTTIVQDYKAYAYNGKALKGQNIIGSFNPENPKRIFLCAHWDSRHVADHDPDEANHNTPIDGANDGASGVGVLLEIAKVLSANPPPIGVDIILFDLEDYGPPQGAQSRDGGDYWGLGSQYWSKNPHVYNYKAKYGILLDMVGDTDARFLMEGFSLYHAPHIVKKVWENAEKMGYGDYFVKEKGGYITDDHYYINEIAGIPTIDIIHLVPDSRNGSFVDYWHTIGDTLGNIDPQTLKVVGKVVLQTVFEEGD